MAFIGNIYKTLRLSTISVASAMHVLFAAEIKADPAKAEAFFQRYCTDCHGEKKSKGKITLHDFPFDSTDSKNLKLIENVLDTLKTNDMPPDDEEQPSDQEREAMVAWLDQSLRSQTEKSAAPVIAASTTRRLTNVEYEQTMRELFGLPLQVKELLPEDPQKPYHFNNNADFMLIGPEQVERYLEAARQSLSHVIVDPAPPKTLKQRFTWKAEVLQNGMAINEVGIWGNRRDSPANGFTISNPPTSGEFILRFKASAILTENAQELPLRFVMGYSLAENSSTLRMAPIGTVRLKNSPKDPQEFELRGRFENFPIRPATPHKNKMLPPSLTITPQNLYDDGTLNDNIDFQKSRNAKMPRAIIEWAEIEGPITQPWPPAHHTRILFDSPLRESNTDAYVREVLTRFLNRAFRRPVTRDEVQRFVSIYEIIRKETPSFEHAMRETLAMALVSPQFLFHTVADGEAVSPSYELASRLSYFLWKSMPDEELLSLAARGQLNDPKVVEKQVLRMLDDKRSETFIRDFTMQWLSLAKSLTVPINVELFPRFLQYVAFGERKNTEEPYRPTIREYMLQESIAFVGVMIRKNLNPLNVVDSNFAMLNQRLAAHYGVPNVHGDEIRAVAIKPEHQLGGLLTNGSVLVGNGTGTAPHPIYRAVWLREAILGEYVAPPPAEVPALTDTAGESAEKALSIKVLLEKHRTVESCNDCHARLDPWGIPFEHYNAIGQFQPKVPKDGIRIKALSPGSKMDLAQYNEYLKSINVVDVDATTRLPKGPEVNGLKGLKNYLIKERSEDINRNIIRRLMTYGIGRELSVHDRPAIEAIQNSARSNKSGMRDIIVSICQSELFQATSNIKTK